MKANHNGLTIALSFFVCMIFASIHLDSRQLYAQTPFYQGKTITVILGAQPGGSADMRARSTASVLGKHVPGKPTIIAGYMPGGGGRKLANYMFRAARPNGRTIAMPASSFTILALLGAPGVRYELDKFTYLGTPQSQAHYVFLTRKELGLDSLEKLRKKKGLRIGAQSVGHTIYIIGRLFAYGLNLNEPKFITGYSGPELDLAVLRGEVDARVNLAHTVMQRRREMVEKNLVDFHASLEVPRGFAHPHPTFAKLPDLEDLAGTGRARKPVAMFRSLRYLGSPMILGPGNPEQSITTLKQAIDATFVDPEFKKQFTKLTGIEPSPRSGSSIAKDLKQMSGDKETIELFRKIATAGPLPPR
ncbi:MAG: hypothetical protein GTO40_11960 [Deltaproteobacteria bacterium]|nr:hypothetical protein [Deltaproteobacteria bacterium]